MNKNPVFIMTTDQETADKLIAEGFRLVDIKNGKFTFENKSTTNFSCDKEDLKNVAYTNTLTF